MNRNFSLIFVLLAILSIVNAIPHKRATTFQPCTDGNPLDVTISPDPLVPGGSAEFSVSGKVTPPAMPGSAISIAFLDSAAGAALATPFVLDLCKINGLTCPLSEFSAHGPVNVPANLPTSYTIVVAFFDSAGTKINCELAYVGTAVSAARPAPTKFDLTGSKPSSSLWTK